MSLANRIAIIGTSGNNAAAWTQAFLARGWHVKSLVRDTSRAPATPRRAAGFLDLDDRATFAPALADVDHLALVTPADPRQVERERNLIEAAKNAAKNAALSGIIKLSVSGAELASPISPFARWSAEIEKALAASGVPFVLLRANAFMQNLLRQRAGIEAGTFIEPVAEAATSYVDVGDIAEVAAAVADGPLDGRALTLTGPAALTGREVAAALSAATGREVRFVSPDLPSLRAALSRQGMPAWRIAALAELYEAVLSGRAPHLADVSQDIARVLGRPARSLLQFVETAFGSARR